MMKFPQLQPFTLYGSGVVAGDVIAVFSTMKKIDGSSLAMSDFGDIGYLTHEPGNGAQEEQISFTGLTQNGDGTTTLTGIKTVLMVSPYTETSGYAIGHSGQTQAVAALTSGLLNHFVVKENDASLTGIMTFLTASRPKLSADADTAVDAELVTYGQLYRTAIAGTTNADETHKGVVEEATDAETEAGTAAGATGAELFVTPAKLSKTIQKGSYLYAVAVEASANTYTGTHVPAITALTAGMRLTVKFPTAVTGDATYNPNGLGAKSVQRFVSGSLSALVTGDIVANQTVDLEYDGTRFVVMSPTAATLSVANTGSLSNMLSSIYGDGSDGDVTISAPTTLTKDMCYNNLTLNDSINAAGFKIRVKGTLTRADGKKIYNNGGTGGTGGNAGSGGPGTAGTAGSAAPGITLPLGAVGGAGAAGVTGVNNGLAGSAGTSTTNSLVSGTGGAGGAGIADGSETGGAAGGGATSTITLSKPLSLMLIELLGSLISGTFTPYRVGGGGGGGGSSGADNSSDKTGGSGGGGGGGGVVFVAAKTILLNGTGDWIEAKGGSGGNGGNSYSVSGSSVPGSSGGGGGAGGCSYLIYSNKTNSATVNINGGTGGTGGAGAGTVGGPSGNSGNNGGSGLSYEIQI